MLDFGDAGEMEKEAMLGELFAIFYVNDGYIALRDPEFLQKALDILVETFEEPVSRPTLRRRRQ